MRMLLFVCPEIQTYQGNVYLSHNRSANFCFLAVSHMLWKAHCFKDDLSQTSAARSGIQCLFLKTTAPGKIGESIPDGFSRGKAVVQGPDGVTTSPTLFARSCLDVEPAKLFEIAVNREEFPVFQGLLPSRHSPEEQRVGKLTKK